MNGRFKLNSIRLALCLAFPAAVLPVFAAEPFPYLPVSLSTSVTPNVMLVIDTSGSMGQCPAGSPRTCTKKTDSVKSVADNLIENNKALNWGVFSFDVGGVTGGVLQSPVLPVQASSTTTAAVAAANLQTLHDTINALGASGTTPLGETLVEVSRYWAGENSYYSKIGGNYVSPIAYRCQKNFNIFLSDGASTSDDELPGLTTSTGGKRPTITNWPTIPYNTWDAAGNSQSLNFNVCKNTTTAINSNISCPSILEGSTASTPILDGSVYQRSIRDVAAYLYDRDFKYNLPGLDGDGKSWDDPKFRKQNVMTYTVGFDTVGTSFATANTILKAAAQVGGGQYFAAANENDLNTALTTVVQSIINSTSNAGGLATTSPYKFASNKLFQPVFNPQGWYGELRCYDYASVTYDANGNILTGACTPNPKANFPATRYIFSSSWLANSASFDFKTTALPSMTSSQQTALGATVTDRQNVISFLRGDTVTGANYRSRTSLLGDIIDSQPVVVAAPSGVSGDGSYAAFQLSNASRGLVFVGANDGMMHAFRISDMAEVMGYIPAPVYPHLASLTSPNYGVSAGTPHVYHVNGEVRQADLKLGGAWQTLLVGGLAQGGQGFYALNATSAPILATKDAVKWEFNDKDDSALGYTFGAPLIYNVRDSSTTVVPAVVLVNGYENDYDDTAVGGGRKAETAECTRTVNSVTKNCNTSALYVVNADTGALIKKIAIDPGRSDGIGGLSSPSGVDAGQDGILDYVYAGDLAGRVWRFDLTDANSANWSVGTNPIFDAGTGQPITMRPVVKAVSTTKNLVMFGTGKLLSDSDRTDTTVQSFYAVLDDMSAAPTTVSKTSLLQRTLDTDEHAVYGTGLSAGTYRKVIPLADTDTFDLTLSSELRKGWYLNFPTSSERLVSSPILLDYMLLFGTGIPLTTEKCTLGGKGWVMGLDPLKGGVLVGSKKSPYSFVDVSVDGKSTTADKVAFATGSAYVSGFETDGIPTELTYVADQSRVITVSSSGNNPYGNAGNVIALRDANIMSVYAGNAAANTPGGNAQDGLGADGSKGGRIAGGTVGGSTVFDKGAPPEPGSGGYSVQTTIWREIK